MQGRGVAAAVGRIAALCASAALWLAPVAAAQDDPPIPPPQDQLGAPGPPPADDQPDLPIPPPHPGASAPDESVPDAAGQADLAVAKAEDRAAGDATGAWFACSTEEAARLDDGRSDAATIAEALSTSCQPEWDASKAEQCQTSELTPQACAMLSDKLDANRRSYEIKVVLAFRARKTRDPSP